MKVLVIEDEPLIRDIYSEFLELLGHEADVAVDGREGLRRSDSLVHKTVVADFLMPELTGLEIAEAIHARSRTMPILMVTGSAAPRAAQAGLRFLRTPVAFAEFKATLAEVAEHAGGAR